MIRSHAQASRLRLELLSNGFAIGFWSWVEAACWEGLAKRLLASQLFHEMQLTNTPPDEVTFGGSVWQVPKTMSFA